MSFVRYTTNPDEFDDLPGVVIAEQNPPGFIQGAQFGWTAIVGETLRGPVDTPVVITSLSRFVEVFGERTIAAGGATINKVRTALLNKPFGKLTVVRAAASAAAIAEADFDDSATPVLNVAASSRGSWGNDLAITIANATDGNADHFNLTVVYRGNPVITYENLDISATGNNNLASKIDSTDPATLITVTKLADGRPDNVSEGGLTDTAGTEGTIAATDYSGSGRAMDVAAGASGPRVVFLAEYASAFASTIKSKIATLAAAANDRVFLMWSGTHGDSKSTVEADVASYRSDRILYLYNSPYTRDPDTGLEVQTPPDAWAASIISQQAVNKHLGRYATQEYTAGITRLTNSALSQQDFADLGAAGINVLKADDEGGHTFVEGRVTSLTPGLLQFARRQSADYVHLSLASALKYLAKEENTEEFREQVFTLVTGWLDGRKRDRFVVQDYEVKQDEVNTQANRDQGIEIILVRVKLIGHARVIVIKTEIGETVNITVEE